MGMLTAAVAWYVSAAVIVNSLSARPVPPVGGHLWSEARGGAAPRPFPTT
jgi:hypothetical protein